MKNITTVPSNIMEELTQVKKSKEEESVFVYGLYAEKRGRGKTKVDEVLLSIYKSQDDADFIRDYVVLVGKHNVSTFNLSQDDELFVKKIPAFVSFGETLPSDEETVAALEAQLGAILESLEHPSED